MRSKRLTRPNKADDASENVKKSGTGSGHGVKHRTRMGETSFLTASTPAKQSTRTCGDTGLSDDTDDDISLVLRDTPTGLRMKSFFRDEFLSSQTADSQLDVRWDHTSPDAFKRLQRVPKKSLKQAREDLSDIVCRLAPAVGADGDEIEAVSNTPPLLCSWLQANKATSNNAPFEGQIFKHGQRTKRGLKKKRKPSVQKFDDVLNNLHMCLERLDDEDEENDKTDIQRSSRSSTEDDTLFPDDKDQNRNHLKPDNRLSNLKPAGIEGNSLLPQDAAQALLEDEEDLWSDDELFEDNSFILQATQLPVEKVSRFSPSIYCGKRKQISPVLDQPKNKTKRCGVSPKWENEPEANDLIPPTCATRSNLTNNGRNSSDGNFYRYKQNSVPNGRGNMNAKTNVNNNVKYGRQNSSGFNPGDTKLGNKLSSGSPFRKHSSFSGYEANKPKAGASSSTVTNNNKSPWRKTSSFSGRCTVSNSNQRHHDQSTAAKPMLKHKQVQNSLFKDQRAGQNVGSASAQGRSSAGKTVLHKEAVPAKKQVSPTNSHKRNSLDTSWSDEILRQLAEPDEILESQINVIPVVPGATKELAGEFEDFFDSDNDFSINETMMTEMLSQNPSVKKCSGVNSAVKSVSSYTLTKPSNTAQPKQVAQKNKQHESNQNELAKLSLKSHVNSGPVTRGATACKSNGVISGSASTKISSQKPSSQSRFTFRSTGRQQVPLKHNSTCSKSPVVGAQLPPTQQHTVGKGVAVKSMESHSKKTTSIQSNSVANPTTTNSDNENISDTQALMSSQALLEDDSFMKDDALFESQIMALLDEVEYEATQQSKADSDADKISCSPDEIEKKRLAALAKRKEKAKR